MSPATVVRLAETEWRAFAALRLRALRDTLGTEDMQYRTEVAFTAARWRRRLRTHAQFVAVIDERMVGLIGAQLETVEMVYLYSLWLEPSARHQGLARDLVSSAVAWARTEHALSVTLRVEATNVAAVLLYEGLGFVVDGVSPTGRPDEVTMRLDVS